MNTTKNLQDAMEILAKASSACFGDTTVPQELLDKVQNAKRYIGTQLADEVLGQ